MAEGTIQGKLKVYVKEDDTTLRVGGSWVRIKIGDEVVAATYTDSKGIYTITAKAGKRYVEFFCDAEVGKPPLLLWSAEFKIKAGEFRNVEDVIMDPDKPGIPPEVKAWLEKFINDPPIPGYVVGVVHVAGHPAQTLSGAYIWTDKNYNGVNSNSLGEYCLSRPGGITYALDATRSGFQQYTGSVKVPLGGTRNKDIPMTP